MSLMMNVEEMAKLKAQVERERAPVIYLHGGPEEPSFGMLITDPQMREAAEKALETEANWEWYDHSHIDGDE